MGDHKDVRLLNQDQLEAVTGGSNTLGVYRPEFRYKQESLQFFKACVGEAVYSKAMNSDAGRAHHYISLSELNSHKTASHSGVRRKRRTLPLSIKHRSESSAFYKHEYGQIH